MNIEDTLREQLPDLSDDVHGGPSLQHALRTGRARRRRRAAAVATSGVATLCATGVVAASALTGAGPFGAGGGSTEQEASEWALAAPPQDVPGLIEQSVRDQLPDGTTVTETRIKAYAEGDYPYAAPKPTPLPKEDWDEAASWVTAFRLGSGETIRVVLLPHDPETGELADDLEAGLRKYCRQQLMAGGLSCDPTQTPEGLYVTHQETVLQRITEATPSWGAGTVLEGVDPDKVKHPGDIWFDRRAEANPGGDYSLQVGDEVNVPTYEQAEAGWTLDADALQRIATDGDLLEHRSGS